MEKGDQLVIVRDDQHPVHAQNTIMVSVLTTFGVELDKDCPYIETREIIDGKERRLVTWCLKAISHDGLYKTRDLIHWWHDREWAVANPEHPFAYVKQAFANHSRLINIIKTLAPVLQIRRGKKIALIPADASPEPVSYTHLTLPTIYSV